MIVYITFAVISRLAMDCNGEGEGEVVLVG